MKVYTCNDFEGCYPVGSAAVIVAHDKIQARNMLSKQLSSIGLDQKISAKQLIEMDTESANLVILCDGNY